MKKSIDDYTDNDLKYTDPMYWAEKFFLESPEYSKGELKKDGRKSIYEGKFNLEGFTNHLQQYLSAKVAGALELQKERMEQIHVSVNVSTLDEMKNVIKKAVNKGFITSDSIPIEDAYIAAQEFLNLNPRQQAELNVISDFLR